MSEELFPKSPIRLIKGFFVGEKTSDIYQEVEFDYEEGTWQGVLPKYLEKQGLELDDDGFKDSIGKNYELLHPSKRNKWIEESDSHWLKKDTNETYKVLAALHSGKWECRVCGPVPEINPQPSARLSALKRFGYIIGSKRRFCNNCGKTTMHDILVMLPRLEQRFDHGNELRKPMSDILKLRIKRELGLHEVCFNVKRTSQELVIDHKFPSQRWGKPESDNPNDMSLKLIKEKFQLLSNQTNLWKSRYCDNCVKNNIRGDFMGIQWFYEGDEQWRGKDKYDEAGCIGCPWYDTAIWKQKLAEKLQQ
ncbi:hypothetical protein R1T16_13090 [Flavobacterium sp. DG1-102-2]|uniref:hypothetical protein n=1 Tax=Flavobacterium sp. DG1-102-2 TaxID=3081663 RepID=UPI0029498356|nr:hypothetical protein [Flavobacterium sp. DG1-102-2]MDV6169364.1 hypothetical protein [Flavobacterium sp. DG1-102-2]